MMNFYALSMVLILGGLSIVWLYRLRFGLEMPQVSPWITYALFVWFLLQFMQGCVTNTYVYNEPALDTLICSGDPDLVEGECLKSAKLRCEKRGFFGDIELIEKSQYRCDNSACVYLFFKCGV